MMTRFSKLGLLFCAIAFGATLGGTTTPALSADNQLKPSTQTGTQSSLLVTTTESIEGYRIAKYLGVLRGVTVRQPTVGQSLKASFKGIVGGKIGPYVSMCETARQYAYDLLIQRATQVGANAIVGLRYDSSAFGGGDNDMGTEVVCYGTAVVVEPAPTQRLSFNFR